MVVGLTFIIAFATVGALLAWKKPGNPIGWLLSGSGLAYALGGFGLMLSALPPDADPRQLAGLDLAGGPGAVRIRRAAVPPGSLPSRRWRPVAWATGAGLAGWVLGNAFAPKITWADTPIPNPVGVTGTPGKIFTVMVGASLALIAVTGLAAVLSLVFRYRRVQAGERAQLRWLVYAGGLIVVASRRDGGREGRGPGATANNLQNAVGSGAGALIPVAIGVAVLRNRLYDIDRIISRTLAYAIVTGLLVGVYAGLVLLATHLLRVHTPVAVAAATLTAAALFTPVRRLWQCRADRRLEPGRVRRRPDRGRLRRQAEGHG